MARGVWQPPFLWRSALVPVLATGRDPGPEPAGSNIQARKNKGAKVQQKKTTVWPDGVDFGAKRRLNSCGPTILTRTAKQLVGEMPCRRGVGMYRLH